MPTSPLTHPRTAMNTGPERQHAEGTWDKIKGNVKEAVGDATDNHSLEAEGQMDQMKGGAKQVVGDVRGGVRDALDSGDETEQGEGLVDRAVGKVKEVFGDATDNESLQAEGAAQNAAGHARSTTGSVRDDLADRV